MLGGEEYVILTLRLLLMPNILAIIITSIQERNWVLEKLINDVNSHMV